jgi:hypothetical protein
MHYVAVTRKVYPGFRTWTIASFLNGIGLIGMSLRGILPDVLTIVPPNFLIIFFFVMVARGLVEFIGEHQKAWIDCAPLVIVPTTFIYFTYYSPNVSARILIISLLISFFCGRSALIVFRKVPLILSDTNWLLLISLFMMGGWFFIRSILTFNFENHIVDFMSSGILQAISFPVLFVGNIMLVTGLIIINAQRLEHDLFKAMEQVKTLKGMLPICSSCKKIRDDKGYWQDVAVYVRDHSEAEFSHGICPECMERLYPEYPRKSGHPTPLP